MYSFRKILLQRCKSSHPLSYCWWHYPWGNRVNPQSTDVWLRIGQLSIYLYETGEAHLYRIFFGMGLRWVPFTFFTFLLSHQIEQSKSFTEEEDVSMIALSFFWCQLHRKIFLYHGKNFVPRTKKIKNFCNLKFLDVKKCDFMGIFVILSDFLYNLYIPRVLTFQFFLIWVSFFLLLGNRRKWLKVLSYLV